MRKATCPRLEGLVRLFLLCSLVGAVTATISEAETVQERAIMAGTPHETKLYIKQGGNTGGTVFVIGGCHGDETAGYLAADKMKKWQVTAGTLWLIPRAHVTAITRGVRAYPGNMNRMFPGRPDGDVMERLAYETWRAIATAHPDLLLTLHESVGFHREDPARFGQTLTFDFPELVPVFRPFIDAVNSTISDKRNWFSAFVYPVETCPTYCAYKMLGIPATSIETCRKLGLGTRICHQLLMTRVLLRGYGLEWTEETDTDASVGSLATTGAEGSTPYAKRGIQPRTLSPATAGAGGTPARAYAVSPDFSVTPANPPGWTLTLMLICAGVTGAGVCLLVQALLRLKTRRASR